MTDRELDFLVAEHVLGWVWLHGWDDGRYAMLGPREHCEEWCRKFPDCVIESPPADACRMFHGRAGRDFSTEIAAAWMVIEAVFAKTRKWILVAPTTADRFVAYHMTGCADPDYGDFCEYADTAPKAICLAALKAVGVDVEEPLE